ncbi:hypothetical protein JCM11491_004212 [Sporobolomyces phaffii]
MSPDHRPRAALPASFLSPAPPRSPAGPSRVDTRGGGARDLAFAVDGSFVETTSEAAATSMAKFYAQQEHAHGECAIQQRVDRDGRTLYRIRPLSPTSVPSTSPESSEGHLPFARPSYQPQPRRPPANDTPADRSLLHPHPHPHPHPHRRDLRKAGSTPALSNGRDRPSPPLSSFASSADLSTLRPPPRHPSEGDVLGRILGWRDQVVGERTIRKASGSARVALPDLFRKESSSDSPPAKGRSENLDTSDLPEDPVVEELVERAIRVDSDRVRDTSPFGSDVRLPRQHPSESSAVPTLRVETGGPPFSRHERTMREVASNDSIRTATADDPRPAAAVRAPPPPSPPDVSHRRRRPRFQDPGIFDVFHRQQPSPASPPPPQPLGHHARFPSSSSLASSASGHSRATGGQQITVHAAPGDDPRFVIWGYNESAVVSSVPSAASRRPSLAHPISPPPPPLVTNPRRGSIVDSSDPHSSPSTSASASPATTSSRRWSLSARGGGGGATTGSGWVSPATSVRDSVGSSSGGGGGTISSSSGANRILMAATVERVVAELTSEISVELLSDFFLTYRHYLAPLDLLHLLVTRFDWAMLPATSSEDDALRRVVRVRTFVVVRYWLLNHFMDDFYPSREVRTRLTEWLNRSAKDPKFRENPRDARLIKNLKKTVRRCKETFVLGRGAPTVPVASGPAAGGGGGGGGRVEDGGGGDVVKPTTQTLGHRWSEEDVDLELHDPTANSPPTSTSFKFGTFRARKGSTTPLVPAASVSSSTSSEPAFPLPGTSQNPIARSFATALGTFGRFKRMIGHRTASNAGLVDGEPADDDVEFEQNEAGDLLWVKGGLEKYLEYWDIRRDEPGDNDNDNGPGSSPGQVVSAAADVGADPVPALEVDASRDAATPKLAQNGDDVRVRDPEPASRPHGPPSTVAPEQVGLGILTPPPSTRTSAAAVASASTEYAFPALKSIHPPPPPPPAPASGLPIFDPESYTSASSSPLAAAAAFPYPRPASARIELDDLDDSDSEDDEDVVEVKRTLKRLPNAHNLRRAAATSAAAVEAPPTPGSIRSSLESETSYGFGSGPARLSYGGQERESVLFVDDEEGGEVGVTVIPNFILEGLLDSEDEDEPGDVEAALRRLEGLVDTSREREKAKKVERQMQRSEKLEQERKKQDAEAPDSDPPALAARVEENEAVAPTAAIQLDTPDPAADPQLKREVVAVEPEPIRAVPSVAEAPMVPFSSQASPPITTAAPSANPLESTTARTPSRLGVPPAYPTVAGRKATLSRIFGGGGQPRPVSSNPSGFASAPSPPTHRSFLLFCRTETLAQQFTLIERDMLRMLSYQELVSGSWRNRLGATDVLDWELYLKERRKEDLAARDKGEQAMSAVRDVITRFNLMANWVGSEILLTANIDERAILIGKFIRLAFKCYCQSNFQTVMQIVHGLQIPHVERLRKTWAKVPSWEIRKLEGMQRFVSHLRNFTHLRDLMNRLAAEYSPGAERSSLSDPISTLALKGCIPFTGLFLRDLALNAELPTFLDPTCTNAPAAIDRAGSLTSVADPNAFGARGDDDADLFPLVNLHKFRKLAAIVHRIRTFQALSERYPFEPVPHVYFKCLKIRSLDHAIMHELSSRLEP